MAHLNNAYLSTLWVDFKALSHGNAITIEKSSTLQWLFGKTLRFAALRVMFSHITTASTTIYIKVCYFKKNICLNCSCDVVMWKKVFLFSK